MQCWTLTEAMGQSKKQTIINTGESVSRNLPQAGGVYNSPSATEQKDAEREWKKGHGPQDHIPAL